MPAIYPEALPKKLQAVLEILKNLPIWEDFYLAGGSGLALQINHRISVDFDLFSATNKLGPTERGQIRNMLINSGNTIIRASKDETLEIIFNGVRLSFFHYDYPLIALLVRFNSIKIASIADIGSMKLASIVGRGSKRDFVDIYFIIREHIPLSKLVFMGEKKFHQIQGFSVQALHALVYFEDAEPERMPKLLKKISWEEIKSFLKEEVKKLSRNLFDI